MWNWTRKGSTRSQESNFDRSRSNTEIHSNGRQIPEAQNLYTRSLKKDFENFTDFMHQQMMRTTIINLDVAREVDIEQMRMEQLKAMRLRRIG